MSSIDPTISQPIEQQAVRRALASSPRPSRPSIVSMTLAYAWRGMLKVKHVPEQLVDVTITPVMFVLMFTYLFGGAVAGSTAAYLGYIPPRLLVMTGVFPTVSSGLSLNPELTKGGNGPVRVPPRVHPHPAVRACGSRRRCSGR